MVLPKTKQDTYKSNLHKALVTFFILLLLTILTIFSAEALQSVLQLMGEKELYEFWTQSYKVLHFSWDQEKAALVLKTWQKKFNEVSTHFNLIIILTD